MPDPFGHLIYIKMNEQNQNINQYEEEQEIDILAIVKRLWDKRKLIITITCCFMVLGLFVALFSPKVYTSSVTFVPQSAKKGASGGLSSLAAMAGINLGDMSSAESLSPNMYPQILDNIDFKKDLMYSKVKFQEWEEPIALIDYYTNPEYKKTSVFGTIKKYTIGLPFVILKAIKGEDTTSVAVPSGNTLKYYTKDEFECAKALGEAVSMTLEEKKGYITITTNMGEPLAAAQLCQITFDLLGKYVTEFKIDKAKAQMEFIQSRYDEKKAEYEEKQLALATFQDANRVISSAKARTELERLTSEYNMANTIYTEMAKQLLQADIQVKEDTPVLTAVKPVVVPYKKAKPQRAKILFICTFLGGILGCGIVLGLDWLVGQGINLPIKWEVPVEEEK